MTALAEVTSLTEDDVEHMAVDVKEYGILR